MAVGVTAAVAGDGTETVRGLKLGLDAISRMSLLMDEVERDCES